jgi:capsular polysaccharide transport system permease protein
MSDPRLSYVGPVDGAGSTRGGSRPSLLSRIPVAFLIVVVLPTVVTAIYFLFIATPRYVSEARFIVRAATQEQPSSLGVALQGVGLSSNATDSFAVHEYIKSRDSLTEVSRHIDVPTVLAASGADPISRYPRPWQSRSNESLFKAFQRFVTVGYETSTGISTLRVESFRAEDSQRVAQALLDGGEALVNRLNERSSARAVEDAQRTVIEAEARLNSVQVRLTNYRNSEGIIDPTLSATEGSTTISGLLTTVASLRAERAETASQAPQSPQLPLIDARIAAFERQIAIERQKIAGDQGSLASKISGYETLALEREFADKSLGAANAALDSARQDARRQKLYLERVVNPSRPDRPSQPQRLTAILAVFVTMLLLYGLGWLTWAGLREHRQL